VLSILTVLNAVPIENKDSTLNPLTKRIKISMFAPSYIPPILPVPEWIQKDPHPAQVLKTAAGWYIGTLDSDGMPYARWTDYIDTEKLAKKLLETGEWKKFARMNP
jgi:hypothetical protein